MKRRVDQFLIALSLVLMAINLATRSWPYVLISLLTAWVVWQGMRISRLEDENTALRAANMLHVKDPGGDGWT